MTIGEFIKEYRQKMLFLNESLHGETKVAIVGEWDWNNHVNHPPLKR